jgi:hypothetical protein
MALNKCSCGHVLACMGPVSPTNPRFKGGGNTTYVVIWRVTIMESSFLLLFLGTFRYF